MNEYLDYQFIDSPEVVDTYDELSLWSAPFGLLLLKHLELEPKITVLDIGFGTGFPLIEIAERLGPSCKVFGLDPWLNAHIRAKLKTSRYDVRNLETIAGVGEHVPFRSDHFDLIVSNLGINNFENPDQVLSECNRILKPAGRVSLTTNLFGHWKEFYDVFAETLTELGRLDLVAELKQHEEHRITIRALSALFAQNGLAVTRYLQDQFEMKFLNGSAFLRHHFVKLGFLDAWKGIIPPSDWPAVFAALETNLNQLAHSHGSLRLTVPMAYIEGRKE